MIHFRRFLFVSISIIGALLLIGGVFVFTSKDLNMVSGMCIGLGSAMLALGLGNLLYSFMVPVVEDKIKQLKSIEVKDERNTRIREKSGYMISKIMNYMIYCLILVLVFMNVNKILLVAIAFVPLINLLLTVIFSNYYSKRI